MHPKLHGADFEDSALACGMLLRDVLRFLHHLLTLYGSSSSEASTQIEFKQTDSGKYIQFQKRFSGIGSAGSVRRNRFGVIGVSTTHYHQHQIVSDELNVAFSELDALMHFRLQTANMESKIESKPFSQIMKSVVVLLKRNTVF